ncbi:MAG: hypothetical protein H7288_11320 [Kineosporiaceae bacterium]|nr:hypothetical protein [Aeromicrobium sp.]
MVYAYQEKQARAKGVKKREKAKHGTATGYTSYRCHVSAECPSKVAGGISCSEAQTAYRAAYRAGLKKSAMEKAA